jgi:hypothetical protein
MCKNKVTHTQTISNGADYSQYTWKASPTEETTSMAAPCHGGQKQFYDDMFPS